MAAKVRCALCAHRDHVLIPHLRDVHGYDATDMIEYSKEHRLFSQHARKVATMSKEQTEEPQYKEVPLADLFPEFVDDTMDLEGTCFVRTNPGPFTPRRDPQFIFPYKSTLELITILEKPTRNNVYLAGPTGVGKTALVKNLAAVLGQEVMELTADSHMTREQTIGRVGVVKSGDVNITTFHPAIAPIAAKRGAWLLVNEYDKFDPATANTLKTLLECNDRRLTIAEQDHYEVVHAAGTFRFIATCNTWGRGDDTGDYVSSIVQDAADLQRFHGCIEVGYLPPDTEKAVLARILPDLPMTDAEKFVKVAGDMRNGYKQGSLGRTLSTQQVITWAENYMLFNCPSHAARITFLNAFEPETQAAVTELIRTHFGSTL